MKKLLFFLMAIIFAIASNAQTSLNEGFEATTFPPEDWTAITTSGTNQWSRNTSSPIIGTASVKCAYRSGGHISYLITPKLVVSANDTLKFFAAKSSSGTTNFRVCVSTTYQQNGLSSFDTVNPLMSMLGNNMSTTFTQYNVDLSQFAGQEVHIAFQITDYYGCHIFLDNITGPNLFVPTCPKPTSLNTNNPTTTGINLGWTDPTGTIYNIQYMLNSETDWANATTISGVTNPYTFNTLNPSTNYKARVQRDCSIEQSDWSTPITFTTACEALTQFPWTEGFENAFNTVIGAPGNKPSPFCWYIIDSLNTSSYYWQSSTSSHTGSKAVYMYGYGAASSSTTASYQNNDWLISPVISFTGNERLNFWSKKSSTSYFPDLLIYAMDVTGGDLNNTASNSNFVFVGAIDTNILSTTYSQYEFNLSSLVGDHRLAFVRKKTASGSVYIDDLKISAIPNCFPPTEITVNNISTDQADLDFTPANSTGGSWYVILKNVNDNLTDTIQVYTLPHTFYNLTPNTNYSITIMTDCGDGTFSDATSPVTFRTHCVPLTVPYLETFTTSVIVEPTCWTRMNGLLADTSILTSSTSGWYSTNNLDTAMYINIYGSSVKYWLISPTIDLGDGSTQYQAEFDVVLSAYSGAPTTPPTYDNDDKFAVIVSTDNGLTWLKANAKIWAQGDADTVRNYSNLGLNPTHVVIKLADSLLNPYIGYIKIGFYGESTVSGPDNNLYIDNFAINQVPNCPAVYNTTASVDNFSSIRVNFATDNAEPGVGWDIAYAQSDIASFNPNTATIISVSDASQVPYIITGLNAGSTYCVSVRQNCGGDWSPAVSTTIPTLTTAVILPYVQNFEDLNNISEWTFNNPDSNKWYISNAVSYPNSGNSLYISNTLGATNNYANNATSYAYAYTNVDFGTGAAEYNLSFDWRAQGESANYDYMRVYMLPINESVPATGWPAGQLIGTFNLQSTWQHASVILPASEYENTVKKLVFVWWNDISGGTNPPAAVDNINIIPLTCSTPSNLIVNSVTTSSADLSWTENGSATQWIVEYSTDNSVWQSVIATSNTNFILSGLNSATDYFIRIYSSCSSTDSSYSVNTSFTTECSNINQFPWVESFEGITANNDLPNCWTSTNINSTTYTYIANQSTYNRIARTGTKFASFRYGANDSFTTPIFDLNAGTNYSFTFWYITDGLSGWQNLQVRAIDVSDSTNNMIIGTPVLNATNTSYQLYLSNFTPTTTGAYKFKIECQATSSPWYLSFDDVKLEEANCLFPENVHLSNITPTSVDMTWDAGLNSTWIVEHKISSDTVWTSDIASTNQYTFTSLLPQTAYDFRVATLCTNDTSLFITISQTTPCSYITTLPWNDNFDTYGTGSSIYPQCWIRLYNTSSANPYISSTNFSAPGSMYFTSASGKYSIASTPGFDPSIQINTLSAMFRLRTSNATSKLIVGVMSNPFDSLSFDSITTLMPAASSTWQEFEVNFSSYTGTGNYIAFKSQYNTATNTFYIDDLSVYVTPSCARPLAISASSLSNSIDVTITPAEVTDTQWKVFYRALGSTDWDSITSMTTVATIPNLLPGTEYEIYATTVCFDGSNSNATNFIIYPTQQIASQVPYTCDFETAGNNGWLLKNGTAVNRWMIGTPTLGTSNALFISNNNADATYTLNSFSVVVAEKLFEFNTTDSIQLSFDLTVGGESSWDYLKVFLVDKDTIFNPSNAATYFSNSSYSTGVIVTNNSNYYLNLFAGTQPVSKTFASPGIGEQKKLVFVWKNDGSSGDGNSSIIDNISLNVLVSCAAPTNLTALNVTHNSANLAWSAGAQETEWQVRIGETADPVDVTSTIYPMSNLTPNTNYTVYVRANCGGTYSSWVSYNFTTLANTPPTVVTNAATSVAQTTATINGTVTSGTEVITAQGFEWKLASASTWTIVPASGTTISSNLTGLTVNTTYEFRAFATTASGTVYGSTLTFITSTNTPPTVVTTAADQIAQTVATLNGTITEGSETLTAQGFEWKAASASNWTTVNATGTSISYPLTGLTANTEYKFRAFATTASGTVYGDSLTFTTLANIDPVVTTDSVSNLTGSSATLYGTITSGTETLTAQGFEWKASSETTWTNVNGTLTGDVLSYDLTGLVQNTAYDFRAYASTASATFNGTTVNFTTLGLNEVEGNVMSIMMYPNPTSNQTNLIVNGVSGDAKIVLSDMQGRILNTTNVKASNGVIEQSIDVSNLAKGVYYIRIQNNQISKTQKLIVK